MHRLPAMAVADELGVFAALASAPATAEEIAQRLGFNRRGTDVLLSMLSALGLVAARDGRHELADVGRTYLLPDSPYYWGPLLRVLGVVPQQHEALIRALRAPDERAAPMEVARAEKDASPTDAAEAWTRGQIAKAQAEAVTRLMHCHSLPASVGVARNGNLRGVSRLLDIGGGSGCFSIAIAQQFPSIRCTVLELPAVCDAARRYIADGGVADRVDTMSIDMFRDAWPRGYDGMFFSNIFHDWNTETNLFLSRRAYEALQPGGRIFLHEQLLAEDGSGPVTTAAFSMLMLLGTRGRQYTFGELRQILSSAGFVDMDSCATYGYYSVVSGRKA
ncbi:MAG TPA: methyltransferase [Gammaproteobacteria bacterium]|nr:methyltransferase [Gammaproteobacteria bacterium]